MLKLHDCNYVYIAKLFLEMFVFYGLKQGNNTHKTTQLNTTTSNTQNTSLFLNFNHLLLFSDDGAQ